VERNRIKSIIEGLLFISGEPLSLERIVQVLEGEEKKEIRAALTELVREYEEQGRGLRIAEVAGGYQLETLKDNAEFLARLVKTRPIRLSKPSLETLAIIAYRQPVTRLEVDQIRGVDSSGVIATLLEYGFIAIVGRKDVPGRPFIYGTTKRFLEFFRLKSLADLPGLDEFMARAEEQAGDQNLFTDRSREQPEAGPEETKAGDQGQDPGSGGSAD
jgi:segregation and condensation protein B